MIHEKRKRGRPRGFNSSVSGSTIQSLDRAMTVLKIIAEGNGLSLSEAAETAGIAPASIYRILVTLQGHGMVDFDEINQVWFVGVETFRVGANFLRGRRLTDYGRSVMQRLVAESGETANLATAEEDCVVFVSQVETHEPIRAFFRPGTRGPYHGSGIGKAILAVSQNPRIESILKRGLEAYTPNTLTSTAVLIADLKMIQQRGYAVDDEERNLGMRCVAAAIFNEFGEPIGGISLSGPSVRVTPSVIEILGPRVRDAAADITEAIGGQIP